MLCYASQVVLRYAVHVMCVDGRTDGWTEAGGMDGRIHGGWMDGWLAGWMDGWMDGRTQASVHVAYECM